MNHRGYPSPRPARASAPIATPPEQFDRMETTDGFAVASDTETELITFSGQPDQIEVFVGSATSGVVRFARRDGRDSKTIRFTGSERYTQRGGGFDRVFATRDAPGAYNVQVIGRWAARLPALPVQEPAQAG